MKYWISALTAIFLSLPVTARAAPVLVDTQWLEERLDNSAIVIVDMTDDQMQYRRFHIPEAVRLPYSALVRRTKSGVALRIPDRRLFALLGELGISRDHHVVIYDDMGGLHAGRLFWELERGGHPNVSVLDGGLVKWILEGRRVDNRWKQAQHQHYLRGEEGGRVNEVGLTEVKRRAARGSATLLDVRSREEYLGNPKAKRSGHIPGARWWPWDKSVDFEGRFQRHSAANLEASLEAVGVTGKDDPVVLYCRSGHRASQAYLTLRSLGYENLHLFDGSMLEYEQDRGAVLQTGTTPGEGRDACRSC